MAATGLCVGISIILSLVELADACQLYAYGGIGHTDMGLTVGCTMACFGSDGLQVHVLHETGFTRLNRQEKVLVMASEMSDGLKMALVLASYQPISWIVQLSSSVNITSVMLISNLDSEVVTNITIYGGDVAPTTIRAAYPFISHHLAANPINIIRLAEHQYGGVTSYTEAEHTRMWQLRESPNALEYPCLPADLIVLRPPPYPHPTLPPIPTELVTVTISTTGSVFIGVVLTVVLGFVPLFLCLCCLCFRARRNRTPQGDATSGLTSIHTTGAPPDVILAGADPGPPDLPPAYELSIRPALPPAPPDYEKVDDDLPPPYSAVVAAMKTDSMWAARV